MKDEISNNDLLIIRACKRNRKCYEILRRVVARRYALSSKHLLRHVINRVLLEVACDFDLIRDIPEFITYEINPKKDFWLTKQIPDYDENLTEKLISVIRLTEVAIFPRYPRPALFRNRK